MQPTRVCPVSLSLYRSLLSTCLTKDVVPHCCFADIAWREYVERLGNSSVDLEAHDLIIIRLGVYHLPEILSDERIACGNKAYLYGACWSYLESSIPLNFRPKLHS
jgi:hypothetical protein